VLQYSSTRESYCLSHPDLTPMHPPYAYCKTSSNAFPPAPAPGAAAAAASPPIPPSPWPVQTPPPAPRTNSSGSGTGSGSTGVPTDYTGCDATGWELWGPCGNSGEGYCTRTRTRALLRPEGRAFVWPGTDIRTRAHAHMRLLHAWAAYAYRVVYYICTHICIYY
jgi:hypothetical protein